MIRVHPDRIECSTLAEASWLRRHKCDAPVVHVRKAENPRRELLGPGKWKTCRKCAAGFRIMTRGDCRAVNCVACRAVPRSRAKIVISPLAVVSLADRCRCGAALDYAGRCLDCLPMAVAV